MRSTKKNALVLLATRVFLSAWLKWKSELGSGFFSWAEESLTRTLAKLKFFAQKIAGSVSQTAPPVGRAHSRVREVVTWRAEALLLAVVQR